MEDMYVKPGNQERGWNDPPQFSYGLQMAHGPQRNLLNKRPPPALTSGAGAPPAAPPSSNPLAPPPCAVAPPLLNPAGPPPGAVATPPPPHLGQMRTKREAAISQSESEPEVEGVMSVLNGALTACRRAVKAQVCNEVAKRLHLMEDSWRSGRLSLPVRRRMDTLSAELQKGRWDAADDIHRSLMVDHVTEVSQWMVGVKRLIAETRNLSPELLEPLQKVRGPVEDSAEPVREPVKEPGELQQSLQLVQKEEEPDSAEPAQNPVEPVQDPVSES